MTKNMLRLLGILARHGGQGTMEVLLQWGEYDMGLGEGEQADARRFATTKMVVANLMRALAKRGFATDDENGYDITDKGRAVLARQSK